MWNLYCSNSEKHVYYAAEVLWMPRPLVNVVSQGFYNFQQSLHSRGFGKHLLQCLRYQDQQKMFPRAWESLLKTQNPSPQCLQCNCCLMKAFRAAVKGANGWDSSQDWTQAGKASRSQSVLQVHFRDYPRDSRDISYMSDVRHNW